MRSPPSGRVVTITVVKETGTLRMVEPCASVVVRVKGWDTSNDHTELGKMTTSSPEEGPEGELGGSSWSSPCDVVVVVVVVPASE